MTAQQPAQEITLGMNPEIICQLITKTREFHAKEAVSFPEDAGESAVEYDTMQILADHADDLTAQEIKNTIRDLEPDQQACLVAIMYLGRGDFSRDEWQNALDEAKANWVPNTAGYLLSNPLIADFLAEGLSQLGYACEE